MKYQKQHGYTILELIVVVAIIAALCAVVISNIPKAKLQLSLARVAYKFEQDLRNAQQTAMATSVWGGYTVGGFGAYVNLSTNKKYIIYADNASPTDNQYSPLNDYVVSTVDFTSTEPGIIIKEIVDRLQVSSNDVSINFSPPNPITTITPRANQNVMYVVFAMQSDLTKVKIVSVNTSGLIEILSDSQICNASPCPGGG